ncbi:MAG: RNA methyltransferase [Ignavibacteria bacterium]|nr:RNA methyltransferase [Ignavibacteria bacterium]
MTEKRLNKFKKVIKQRQKYLTIVLENIHDPHNVSAILRTAEAVGIDRVYLVYYIEEFPKISSVSSASAKKWVELIKFKSISECYQHLRKEKFKIYSSYISETFQNSSLYDLDLTKRIALVFGNENRGLSEEAVLFSDKSFHIPMKGLIQSLNVSVSVAVCLYEALRQRELKGMYNRSLYTKAEQEEKLRKYLEK